MKIRLTTFGKPSLTRFRVLLFLVLWFAYGAAINSSNLLEFGLQQIGVEAIVERGHFYLEGSTSPHLQPRGDVFEYRGHKYAAKQPGQFMAGAVVYFFLNKLGLNYVNHYLLAAALVTFFTTSLMLAASAVVFFEFARELTAEGSGLFWPLAATLSYALATTAFAYSGIAHHDAISTGCLLIAFYFVVQLSRKGSSLRAQYLKAAAAGLLLGLTLTFSMLPFFMVVVCLVYFFSMRPWRLMTVFIPALIAGLLPVFIYNAVSFGNPFLLPNVAGSSMFSDTFIFFDPNNLGDKLAFYARALAMYVPVFAVGLFGFSYYPNKIRRSPAFLTLMGLMIVLGLFVFNIKSDGDCQFGPRYLLPAMPFACLGIAGYSYLSYYTERRFAEVLVVLAGGLSCFINLVGALRGAMSCPDGRDALWNNFAALQKGTSLSYPLAWLLLWSLVICSVLFVLHIAASRKTQSFIR